MNLDTIAELTICAFTEDETMFYLVADALRDIGDNENAKRFTEGNWTRRDFYEAIEYKHHDIIEGVKSATPYRYMVEARKYPYLVQYLQTELNEPRQGITKYLGSEMEENRYFGKAARALYLLFHRETPNFGTVNWGYYHIVARYRTCYWLGLYKDAAKWRAMGDSSWGWKL